MDRDSILELDAVNRRFYARHADSFDAKRRHPWLGWRRVAEHLRDLERPSILDVGCGNGRFGLYAAERARSGIEYVGVDRSREMLELARRRGAADWRWLEADLVREGLPGELDEESFDLVVCFGVMHHLPGEATRRRLLREMAAATAIGGLLAVSFWQLGGQERFTRRALDVDELERGEGTAGAIARGEIELERGDFLLPWGDGTESGTGPGPVPVRYCHHVDRAEAERLVEARDLVPVDTFTADGASDDLNLYYLLRRS